MMYRYSFLLLLLAPLQGADEHVPFPPDYNASVGSSYNMGLPPARFSTMSLNELLGVNNNLVFLQCNQNTIDPTPTILFSKLNSTSILPPLGTSRGGLPLDSVLITPIPHNPNARCDKQPPRKKGDKIEFDTKNLPVLGKDYSKKRTDNDQVKLELPSIATLGTGFKPNNKPTTLQNRERLFRCDICGNDFKQRHHLKNHFQSKHTNERPFKCNICNKGFKLKHQLKIHAGIHSRDKPFKCDQCGKGFRQKSHLTTHSKVHSKDKPFKCDQCGKGFKHKGNLKTHSEELHKNKHRPFKCKVCNRRFKLKHQLTGHFRSDHNREWPFTCTICQKDFTPKSHLQSHASVHTGEKAYSCDLCKKRFAHKSSLNGHNKRYHKD